MSRSCVCGGSNENCRFCGGSGSISNGLASALVSHVGRPKSENVPYTGSGKADWGTTARLIPCPQGCGARVRPGKMGRHLRKAHGILSMSPQPPIISSGIKSNPKQTESTYRSCPICGAEIRADFVGRHLAEVHPNRDYLPEVPLVRAEHQTDSKQYGSPSPVPHSIATSTRSTTGSLKSGRKYEICPECRANVRSTRIKYHMAKAHNGRSVRFQPTQTPSVKDPTRNTSTLIDQSDKNLDATKPYAHSYREQGRFGSHPSHDGFDDESTPD
jgi:hypothetical protein